MARAVSTRRMAVATIAAWIIALIIFFPILYTIITSLKSEPEAIQDFNLIPALTAAENVSLPRELDGERTGVARRLAREALDQVGIGELADRFPDQMSGGQQQRVAIARAVVGERRLILADEPTGALDTETGEDILRLLRGRCDAGAAGVLVTHEARHAAWADRVVFLRDGVIVDESGTDHADSLLTESSP